MKEHKKTYEEVIADLTRDQVKVDQNFDDVNAIVDYLERAVGSFDFEAMDAVDRLVELMEEQISYAHKSGYIHGFIYACCRNYNHNE